jgi:gamma-glutamyltranspeptidase/glutathione hydrolase
MIDTHLFLNKFISKKRVLLFCVCISHIIAYSQDRITGELFSSRSETIAKNAMVATSHPLASQVGIDILKRGGNAIDAAIAANAAIGLMEPTGNGIGGDLFAIVWIEKEKKLYGLNASGRSPKDLTIAFFKKKNFKKIPSFGPLSVSVPGCVDGWFELHKKFGSLEMKDVLEPAINYAENGFPVTELVSHYMTLSLNFIQNTQTLKKPLLLMGGRLKRGKFLKIPF